MPAELNDSASFTTVPYIRWSGRRRAIVDARPDHVGVEERRWVVVGRVGGV